MHQACHPTPTHMTAVSTKWDKAHKVSIWDGHGTCHTYTAAYVQDNDDDDGVKIKILRKRLANSPIPPDCAGWELYASMDDDCDETYGQATIGDAKTCGRHKILTIPDAGAHILTP